MPDDVASWLEELGLGRYSAAFQKNAIDWGVLSKLDHDLLREMGIAAIGHRIQILEAAAAIDSGQPPHRPEPGQRVASGDAERRQLTVMFCDLVGSTELSQTLDPEDLRDVNRAYQDGCKAAIERYDGYVARYMGDGVLAYFGYPQAHEDDAERAIHAGLGVVGSVARLSTGVEGIELSVRVGIATGPVVVGDLIGEGASQESAVVGQTPNLAARLQGMADKNTVVIAPGTHELVGEQFEYDDLGAHPLKGIAESVHAWRVLVPMAAESRFEARLRSGLTPLVGREQEIGLLLERWTQAKEGDGQVVLLSGEAGIGKSRITEALRERTADDDPVRLHYQCSPYYLNTALHPVIKRLERAAQFDCGDTNTIKLEKLEALLRQGTRNVDAVAPLYAPLLSIPTEGRYAPLETTPERQKEQTLEALVSQMEGLSRRHPVLLIFEDVHWSDPTSLEFLELAIERAQSIPVLLILTYRPEFTPTWSRHTHVTSLTLNRFTRKLASAMVENITGGKSLPDEIAEQIVEKTDGVPLFVEELTKTILESELLTEESNRFVASRPLLEMAIPATLHDSLMARLDRLGAVKEVAQMASAIGREFDYDLLGAVSPLGFKKLRDALNQLLDAELVFRRSRPEEDKYIFKHALVQDAAYGSLLKSKRRGLHGRIAQALQDRFPERAESEPELLAHHFTEGQLPEPAIEQWKKAGLRAMESSANVEAASHLSKGLELFGQLEDAGKRPQEELSMQMPLAASFMGVKGYSAPETGDAYFRAQELCQQIGDTAQMSAVLYGIWNYLAVGGKHQPALKLAQECVDQAQRARNAAHLIAAHNNLGASLLHMGRFDEAQQHLDQSLVLSAPDKDPPWWQDYGEDPTMAARVWGSWVLWIRGFPDQALSQGDEALEISRQDSAIVTAAFAMQYVSVVRYFCGDFEATRKLAQTNIDFCTEHGIPLFLTYGMVMMGRTMLEDGSPEEGTAMMCRGVEEWKAAEIEMMCPFLSALLAQGHVRCGNLDKGLKVLDGALEQVARIGEHVWESELHRLRGAFLLSSSENALEAETCFHRAIDVSREQNAKSFELRAAISLTEFYDDEGRCEEARDLLSPIYAWFTEGLETADLKKAKGLLEQLS